MYIYVKNVFSQNFKYVFSQNFKYILYLPFHGVFLTWGFREFTFKKIHYKINLKINMNL